MLIGSARVACFQDLVVSAADDDDAKLSVSEDVFLVVQADQLIQIPIAIGVWRPVQPLYSRQE